MDIKKQENELKNETLANLATKENDDSTKKIVLSQEKIENSSDNSRLQLRMKSLETELELSMKKLERMQRLYERSMKYNDDLREQVKDLSNKLHNKRKGNDRCDASVQVDLISHIPLGLPTTQNYTLPDTTNTAGTIVDAINSDINLETTLPKTESQPTKEVSIVDNLRAAAEEAVQQSGYAFDAQSNMYYDYNTGYYYDAERGLYYDPSNGTYIYFDDTTQSYKVHSQVDVNQWNTNTYCTQQQTAIQPVDDYKRKNKSNGRTKGEERSSSPNYKHRHRRRSQDRERRMSRDEMSAKRKDHKRKRSNSKRRSHSRESRDKYDKEKCRRKERRKYHKKHKKGSLEEKNKTEVENRNDKDVADEDEQMKMMKVEAMETEKTNELTGCGEEFDMEEGEISDSDHKEDLSSTKVSQIDDLQSSVSSIDSIQSSSSLSLSSDYESEIESNNEGQNQDLIKQMEDEYADAWKPCVRLMVKESDQLPVGSLHLITCTGGSIGRGKGLNHAILLPDVLISKLHAELTFNDDLKRYVIVDHASQNGTLVNGKYIGCLNTKSSPQTLYHGDVLKLGGTTFDLHIHPGTETCADCEPGQVMAKLESSNDVNNEVAVDKEKLRRKQLKQIKKKFGLENMAYVDNGTGSAINRKDYSDKASERRRTVGSDNPYEKTEAPASVHRAISETNKGHKLLQKMGWKEGESLGKSQSGIAEPIQVSMRANQQAGLGSSLGHNISLDESNRVKNAQQWSKARERYAKIEEQSKSESTKIKTLELIDSSKTFTPDNDNG